MADPYRDPVDIPRFRSRFGGLWTDLSNAVDLLDGRLRLGLITDQQAQELLCFIEDGYVILRRAVDETLIDRLNDDVKRLTEQPPPEAWVNLIENGSSVSRAMKAGDGDAGGKMLKLLDLYYFLPSARDVLFSERTLNFLQLIFD